MKTKHYVRSSVLGNEVVSEVWSNGKKAKTFVRAAGAQLAYQSAYYTESSILNEAVIFEYSDASGISKQLSNKSRPKTLLFGRLLYLSNFINIL